MCKIKGEGGRRHLFLSIEQVSVSPPHLKQVFDERKHKSLTTQLTSNTATMQFSFVAVYLTFLLTLGLAGARPVYVV